MIYDQNQYSICVVQSREPTSPRGLSRRRLDQAKRLREEDHAEALLLRELTLLKTDISSLRESMQAPAAERQSVGATQDPSRGDQPAGVGLATYA